MNTQKETKINLVLQLLPPGVVATTEWLRSTGVGLGLVTSYVKSGWLDRVGVGAVIRRGNKVEWPGAIYALQSQLGLSIHPGGKTALGLLGFLHYIPLGNSFVSLFKQTEEVLPSWFTKHDWGAKIKVVGSNLFSENNTLGMTTIQMGEFHLKVSSHERAFIEYLYDLDKNSIGDEPLRLLEGLAWLRPDVVQEMLEGCSSIKVKRIFLALATRINHPWFKKLNLNKIDIGKGKRQFAAGGYYEPLYQITLPRSWHQKAQTLQMPSGNFL